MELVRALINAHESPYGLELLASVHRIATRHEPGDSLVIGTQHSGRGAGGLDLDRGHVERLPAIREYVGQVAMTRSRVIQAHVA